MGSFIICTHHQTLLGRSNQWEWGGQGMWHAWERGETCTGFWWERPKKRDNLKDQGVDGSRGSKWILGRLARGGGCGVDSSCSVHGPLAGCCECGDEPSGSGATESVTSELHSSFNHSCFCHLSWWLQLSCSIRPVAPNRYIGGNTYLTDDPYRQLVYSVTPAFTPFFLPPFFHHQGDGRPDDGCAKYLWNVGNLLPDYTVQEPGRHSSSYTPLWKPDISQDVSH
jgi:hypothetical protein